MAGFRGNSIEVA